MLLTVKDILKKYYLNSLFLFIYSQIKRTISYLKEHYQKDNILYVESKYFHDIKKGEYKNIRYGVNYLIIRINNTIL